MSDEPQTHSTPAITRRGLLFVLSSPSGAGKTTLARRLLEQDPDISMSVSITTRPPRPGEVNGSDYTFLDKTQFEEMKLAGELLEWAEVYSNFYATPAKPVEDKLTAGKDVLFDIDWQGTQQLAQRMPNDLVRIFILPPTAAILAERLRKRNLDSPDVVTKRMAEASFQMSHWAEYDYVIVNSDVEASLTSLRSILAAERLKRERQIGLVSFVRGMQEEL